MRNKKIFCIIKPDMFNHIHSYFLTLYTILHSLSFFLNPIGSALLLLVAHQMSLVDNVGNVNQPNVAFSIVGCVLVGLISFLLGFEPNIVSILFLPFSFILLFQPSEGNIIGFIYAPLLLIYIGFQFIFTTMRWVFNWTAIEVSELVANSPNRL